MRYSCDYPPCEVMCTMQKLWFKHVVSPRFSDNVSNLQHAKQVSQAKQTTQAVIAKGQLTPA